jgi:hypothetical protein
MEKEENNRVIKEKIDDLEILRQKVISLQDRESFDLTISKYREEMQKLEKIRKEYQDASFLTKQAVLKEFNEFIVYCTELKDFQEKSLHSLQEYMESLDPFVVSLSPSDEELLQSM